MTNFVKMLIYADTSEEENALQYLMFHHLQDIHLEFQIKLFICLFLFLYDAS